MFLFFFLAISSIILILLGLFALAVLKKPPQVAYNELDEIPSNRIAENFYNIKNNWIRKNDHGMWELFIEGKAYERGLINGKLTAPLIYEQEKIFVKEIRNIVTNHIYLFFLKMVVAWMNRHLNYHVGHEYNQEIFGISKSASREFSFIGPGYIRLMNYHAAHDIGHTLQDMNFVGCTSFSAWGNRTEDGKLIHGRNFDFHVGDDFSAGKIVTFYAPDKGLKFAMITWGGMIGTVSGMNVAGIAITVNAAKSKLSVKSSTPITILVREILQYASTIEEAKNIALKRKIFVSEAIHVSSGRENKSLLIEKTPVNTEFYQQEDYLICTNHFQSEKLKNEANNLKQIKDYSSMIRYKRMMQLFDRNETISVQTAADFLRDRLGTDDQPLGDGNEIAVNQLIAHHSVIFKPSELKMWVCSGPYSIGEYLCYDLNKVFNNDDALNPDKEIHIASETIARDPFLENGGYKNYIRFKEIRKLLKEKSFEIENKQALVNEMISLNHDSYLSYSDAGDFFVSNKQYQKALENYSMALQMPIPTKPERDHIQKRIDLCKKK
jgi:isopenicillin-N N-acyltransferase like protein